MTQLLEQAIAKLKTLPASEQDAIAALILEELEDEELWDKKFERSQDALALLAAEAMAEDRIGKTQELDPETLLNRVQQPGFVKLIRNYQSKCNSKLEKHIGNLSKTLGIRVFV